MSRERPSAIIKYGGGFVLLAFIAAIMLSIFGHPDQPPAPAAPPKEDFSGFQPEVVFSVSQETLACVDHDTLVQAITYSVRHEKTKFAGLFDQAKCAGMPVSEAYKIIHREGDVIEFVNATSNPNATDGMWAALEPWMKLKR